MFERRMLRGLMLAMGLALVVALLVPSLALADKGNPWSGDVTAATANVTISGNPLSIHVAEDTSIQVFYAGQPDGQVYPEDSNEADSGGFVWAGAVAPQVAGPDFINHTGGYAANLVIPWQSVSQTGPTGTGTAANPWTVDTLVTQLALNLFQRVEYVSGDDCFRVSYTIFNIEAPEDITFFHALDLYVDGEDNAYGYHDAATRAVGGWNQAKDFLEFIVPVTAGGLPQADHYQEAHYQKIWDNIGTGPVSPGPGFNDTRRTNYHDSGSGLQWDLSVPVQDFREVALDWCFLREEAPPPEEFVPEPGSVLLLASGLMGLAGYAGLRKRKR